MLQYYKPDTVYTRMLNYHEGVTAVDFIDIRFMQIVQLIIEHSIFYMQDP
jgi:hypothetical protein